MGANATIEPYQGTIECRVRDAYSGRPIPDVYVKLYHFDTWTTGDDPSLENGISTDGDGRITYSGDPTLGHGSWWTLLFEKSGYRKIWLGNVPYHAGVSESTQASQTAVSHFQVDSNATSTLSATMVPDPVTTALTLPSVSPTSPVRRATVTITSKLSPRAAAMSGTSKLRLLHWETKIVRKKVGSKVKNIKVWYWRLRSTVKMSRSTSGKLTAKVKLAQTGKWHAYVKYAPATAQYLASTSHTKAFKVKWATR